ncbi:hypothetical protein [Pseudodesulfovibrio sediminis]|uniref:Terminase small subunit n=1 Tax=Pseudodesulfovibrio sediminis TaxID=2810563 RepID=A0ABN6EMQ5_9BACT|nr:hypothetical protein [Pseudodesulfovibrio sediminis]BCS87342.1 hypothetical protein PSDVSF_05840 [Pseudodesulfovibrio sediminis]
MKKDKGGRPTKYREEYAAQAKEMCRWGGFTQAKLAKVFGVGKATVTAWIQTYPEFERAIQEGKDIFDVKEAERCLLKLVKGFRYREKKFQRFPVTDEAGEIVDWEMVPVEERIKQVPPNVRAIETFLRSRDPVRWPNAKQIDLNGNMNLTNTGSDLAEYLDEIDGTTQGLEHDEPIAE